MNKDKVTKYVARFLLWELAATVITILICMGANTRLMQTSYFEELPPIFNWEVFLAVNIGMVALVVVVGIIGIIGVLAFYGTDVFKEEEDE